MISTSNNNSNTQQSLSACTDTLVSLHTVAVHSSSAELHAASDTRLQAATETVLHSATCTRQRHQQHEAADACSCEKSSILHHTEDNSNTQSAQCKTNLIKFEFPLDIGTAAAAAAVAVMKLKDQQQRASGSRHAALSTAAKQISAQQQRCCQQNNNVQSNNNVLS